MCFIIIIKNIIFYGNEMFSQTRFEILERKGLSQEKRSSDLKYRLFYWRENPISEGWDSFTGFGMHENFIH